LAAVVSRVSTGAGIPASTHKPRWRNPAIGEIGNTEISMLYAKRARLMVFGQHYLHQLPNKCDAYCCRSWKWLSGTTTPLN
jgi:hypothetical protein